MEQLFIASKDSGENWLICWTGTEGNGDNWNVTTNCIHGSDLSSISKGAKGDAELIANLLNWYYQNEDNANAIIREMDYVARIDEKLADYLERKNVEGLRERER